MPFSRKFLLTLVAAAIVAGLVLTLRHWLVHAPAKPSAATELADLTEPPAWQALDAYQHTIRREDFEALLTNHFTTGSAWRDLIVIDEKEARILTGLPAPEDVFHLAFANPDCTTPVSHAWRAAADLPPAPPGKPLAGLHVAIDPGHIGGSWAGMEERRFVVGKHPPVCEGDLTLLVARLLKPRLEALGATVTLVRDKNEPLTLLRPADILPIVSKLAPNETNAAPQKLAERLFYRTAEIHARARHVNQSLHPDLVLCIHFNAESWGDSNNPTMVERSHLHLLLNGAYSDAEIALADQRFGLLEKLLQRTRDEEIRVGASVAESMAEATGMPPFRYPSGASNARAIPGQPYLWARNLLANRLYQCPVIFTEPYVMNSATDSARILAGDYPGIRDIAGKPRPSIFREYADSVASGLAHYYAKNRKPGK